MLHLLVLTLGVTSAVKLVCDVLKPTAKAACTLKITSPAQGYLDTMISYEVFPAKKESPPMQRRVRLSRNMRSLSPKKREVKQPIDEDEEEHEIDFEDLYSKVIPKSLQKVAANGVSGKVVVHDRGARHRGSSPDGTDINFPEKSVKTLEVAVAGVAEYQCFSCEAYSVTKPELLQYDNVLPSPPGSPPRFSEQPEE